MVLTLVRCLLATLVLLEPVYAENQNASLKELFARHGITPLFLEQKNSESRKVVELGRFLYFDKVLSGNKDISCAACHHPQFASVDALPVPIGTGGLGLGPKRELKRGAFIPRNAPAAFNLGFKSFHKTMWDGRIAVDENGHLKTPEPKLNGASPQAAAIVEQLTTVAAAQAMFPVTSADEMRGHPGENEIADANTNLEIWSRLMARLAQIPEYRELFLKAYPGVQNFSDFNFGHAARAIAAFENFAFLADRSPLDRYLAGNESALTSQQIRGAKLYLGKANCVSCHSGSHLTDFEFYSLGTPQLGPGKGGSEPSREDRGLALLTGNSADNYKFKTPTLRNVALTGPWMHSGVYHSLKDVVTHHVKPKVTCQDFSDHPQDYITADYSENFIRMVDLDQNRNDQRMSSIDSKLPRVMLAESEVEDLVAFLHSLTDESFRSRAQVPKSVPSGLPVLQALERERL